MMNRHKTESCLKTLKELNPTVEPDLEHVAEHMHELATEHHAACVREGRLNMALEHPEVGAYALQREVALRDQALALRRNLINLYHQELTRLLGAVIKADHVHDYLQTRDEEKPAKLVTMLKDGRATSIVSAVPADAKG
jgi:hypothetical protein